MDPIPLGKVLNEDNETKEDSSSSEKRIHQS